MVVYRSLAEESSELGKGSILCNITDSTFAFYVESRGFDPPWHTSTMKKIIIIR